MSKKLKSIVTVMSLVILMMVSSTVYAADTKDPQYGTSMSNTETEKSSLWSTFSITKKDPYTGKSYTHKTRFDGKEIIYAVDVSEHNGTINWDKVKKDGIDYAMIRVGYRSYGSDGKIYEDDNFKQNIRGALNAGFKVGVYFYSQAVTRTEANEEVDFIISKIKGYNVTLPIAMDYEYASNGSGLTGRLYNANLSKDKATDVCKTFCRSMKEEGYQPMIYANKSMLQNDLNADQLSARGLIWLANYTTQTSYSGEFSVWQYTSKGSVSGISGNVDCNFWYVDGGNAENVYNGVDYSAVYDHDYYVNNNPDIKKAFGDDRKAALAHFVNNGMNEGRRASDEFDVYSYKNRYVDLRNAFGNNLRSYYMHYINSGKIEGRNGRLVDSITVYNGVDYSAVYKYSYYINKYSDLKAVFGNDEVQTLAHFVNNGMAEGRQGIEAFNVNTYKNRYVDLRAAFGNNLKEYYMHYINKGRKEGRSGSGTSARIGVVESYKGVYYSSVYDYEYYIEHNPEVKKSCGDDDVAALEHFVNMGMYQGLQGNEEFNVNTYKNRYADLRKAFGNDLKQYYMHYIYNGKAEGRSGKGTSEVIGAVTKYAGIDYAAVYDYKYYIEHNLDVKEAFGDDDAAVLEHFVNSGISEGRQASEEFNVNTYRNRYPDLRKAFGNDLKQYYMHYMSSGKREGRSGKGTSEFIGAVTKYAGIDYAAAYDYRYYVEHNPDIKDAFGEDDEAVLAHFVNNGMSEGRRASADFDVEYYKNEYADLREAFGNDLKQYYMHYIYNGKEEGRYGVDPEADLDTIYKGIDYANVYDYEFYREHNEYVKKLYKDDKRATLIHFVKYGMSAGEIASKTFDVHYYRDSNPELQEQYGDDWEKYYLHYMNIGKEKGRKGVADETEEPAVDLPTLEDVYIPEENDDAQNDQDVVVDDPSQDDIPEESVEDDQKSGTEEIEASVKQDDETEDDSLEEEKQNVEEDAAV